MIKKFYILIYLFLVINTTVHAYEIENIGHQLDLYLRDPFLFSFMSHLAMSDRNATLACFLHFFLPASIVQSVDIYEHIILGNKRMPKAYNAASASTREHPMAVFDRELSTSERVAILASQCLRTVIIYMLGSTAARVVKSSVSFVTKKIGAQSIDVHNNKEEKD